MIAHMVSKLFRERPKSSKQYQLNDWHQKSHKRKQKLKFKYCFLCLNEYLPVMCAY